MVKKFAVTVLSVSGFVPKNMNINRMIFMLASVVWVLFILPGNKDINYAIIYFGLSTGFYIGLISVVLPETGLKLKLIERFGEEKAFQHYEGFLALAFFHNGASLTFISQSSAGSGFWGGLPPAVLMTVVIILFLVGTGIKIWSAWVVGIPIYYCKDMFLGRKISDFVVTGPYKYLKNPMYGIGHLHVYAIALYYNSIYGIIFAVLNQLLVYQFFFTVEKPFILRTYIQPKEEPSVPLAPGLAIPA
jgi:hypothetical protein